MGGQHEWRVLRDHKEIQDGEKKMGVREKDDDERWEKGMNEKKNEVRNEVMPKVAYEQYEIISPTDILILASNRNNNIT